MNLAALQEAFATHALLLHEEASKVGIPVSIEDAKVLLLFAQAKEISQKIALLLKINTPALEAITEIVTHVHKKFLEGTRLHERKEIVFLSEGLETVGLRKAVHDFIERRFNDSEEALDESALNGIPGLEKHGRIRGEAAAIMKRAQNLRALIRGFENATMLFTALAGEAPSGPIEWDVRSYGICLVVSRNDGLKLCKRSGAWLTAGHAGDCSTNIPALDKYLSLVYNEEVIGKERSVDEKHGTVNHEQMHMYFHAIDLDDDLENTREETSTLATLFNPLDGDVRLLCQRSALLHANFHLRQEMICQLLYPGTEGLENIYQKYDPRFPYVALWDPWFGDKEIDGLVEGVHTALGVPAFTSLIPRSQKELIPEWWSSLKKRLKDTMEEEVTPYKHATEEITALLKEGRSLGIPVWDFVDIFVGNEFLRIPEMLRIFIASKKAV